MAVGLMAMPFSTVFVPILGEAHMFVPEGLANNSDEKAVDLPAGVVQVIVTWRGIEPITIRHYRQGVAWETVHRIAASSTPETRTSGVLTLSSAVHHEVQLVRGRVWDQSTLDRGHVAGVQVIPLASAGGV